MVYTLRFFFKCSLFHNSNLFGSCIIHILYTECVKLKKKFRRQKVNDKHCRTPKKIQNKNKPAVDKVSEYGSILVRRIAQAETSVQLLHFTSN